MKCKKVIFYIVKLILFNNIHFLAHLFQFLERLNIDEKDSHNFFGDAGKLIRETFPRQLYLKRMKIEIEGVNDVRFNYAWGQRANVEFDKKVLLTTVAEMMNKSPLNFINQYREVHGEDQTQMHSQSIIID